MSTRLNRRRTVASVATGVALATALLTVHATATAAPADEPASTPVPIATPDGTVSSYLLNARLANAGQTRLVVRHDAAAPAVDVRAGGTVVLAGVTNPAEGVLNIPAGTVDADVVLAGTETVVLGPASLDLAEGSATIVHAVGSAEEGTLALVSFVIPGLHSAPGGVPAGTGPADSAVPTIALVVLLTLGLSVAAVGGRRLYLDRSL